MVEVDVGILGVRGVASTDAGSEEVVGKAEPTHTCHRNGHGHRAVGRRTGKAWSSCSIQLSSCQDYYAFVLAAKTVRT